MTEKILVKHRPTARVLLVNEPRWLTPGGGIDAGESVEDAAVRELLEETGIKIAQDDLGPVFWETSGRWDWSDGIHFQTYTDTIYKLTVSDFEIDNSLWTPDEHRDILEARWWRASEHLRLHLCS